MTSQNNARKTIEGAKPRFTIQKLEERIAPAKGGVPGPPAYHYPGNDPYCPPGYKPAGWGGCCKGGGPNQYCPA